jgi:hypothetical protein
LQDGLVSAAAALPFSPTGTPTSDRSAVTCMGA